MGNPESSIERHLTERVKQLGGMTRKFISPGHAGVADRICFFPSGKVFFVEVKTNDGVETSVQKRERKRMLELGQRAIIVYGKTGVDQWLYFISNNSIESRIDNVFS